MPIPIPIPIFIIIIVGAVVIMDVGEMVGTIGDFVIIVIIPTFPIPIIMGMIGAFVNIGIVVVLGGKVGAMGAFVIIIPISIPIPIIIGKMGAFVTIGDVPKGATVETIGAIDDLDGAVTGV
jgi:hypothetical protein